MLSLWCADLLGPDCLDLGSKTLCDIDLLTSRLNVSMPMHFLLSFLEGEQVACKLLFIIRGFCLLTNKATELVHLNLQVSTDLSGFVPTSVLDLVIEFPFAQYETSHSPF